MCRDTSCQRVEGREGSGLPALLGWLFRSIGGGGCDVKKEVGLERPLVWARLTVLLDVVIPDAGETGGGGEWLLPSCPPRVASWKHLPGLYVKHSLLFGLIQQGASQTKRAHCLLSKKSFSNFTYDSQDSVLVTL